jgi:hypothetical protein
MYIPRPWHNIFPFSLLMLGLYVGHNFKPATYDVVLFCISNYSFALMHAYYIMRAGLIYQMYLAKVDGNEPVYKPSIPNLNTATTGVLYNQTTVAPKFANERLFAFTIVRQHDHSFDVKLTEEYWVKAGRWHGSREEFVAVLDKWKKRRIIQRKGNRKNSSYEVLLWDAVRLIADGNPLPD